MPRSFSRIFSGDIHPEYDFAARYTSMEPALGSGKGRVLIFVVAYRAQRHVVATFQRIPPELFNNDDVHILCIDDASSDETSSVLSEWVRANDIHNVESTLYFIYGVTGNHVYGTSKILRKVHSQ